MRETPEDPKHLQGLLDRTDAAGGPHLLDIHTPATLTRQHYGTGWDEWEGPTIAWAIEADRMRAADMAVRATTLGSATIGDRHPTGVRS